MPSALANFAKVKFTQNIIALWYLVCTLFGIAAFHMFFFLVSVFFMLTSVTVSLKIFLSKRTPG